ncbi:MAG: hypothetical protein GY716_08505 [bacterium]|nr:hypothetical protein [bacterium]
MRLKTYTSTDLATALKKAHDELGPDALVLGTSEKAGGLGLTLVELTVGVARESREKVETSGSGESAAHAAQEFRKQMSDAETTPRTEPPSAVAERRPVDPPPSRSTESTIEILIASGLSETLARRMASSVASDPHSAPGAQQLAHSAALTMRNLVAFTDPPLGQRCTFVVGPPGCGKTTTVAKLVARATAIRKGPIFFAEADCDRIGAFEQAEIYSRHIGAEVARVADPDDLLYALKHAGKHGSVFVDTAGVGTGDEDRFDELLNYRERLPGAAVALLVPAGVHREEASRIIDRFAPIEPTCVGLSRVDDGSMPGELVTALAAHKLPLAFFTNGQSVPEDMQLASPHGLAALLLRAGTKVRPAIEGCP